jgi:membrane dipeptidase
MLIVDAHQDLAWNMLTFSRDYTLPAMETRRREQESIAPVVNGSALLGWPEYQRGRIAVIFATLFAAPIHRKEGAWDTICYADMRQANHLYRAQVDLYARLVDDHPDKFRLILSRRDLEEVLTPWREQPEREAPPEAPPQAGASEPAQEAEAGAGENGHPVGLVLTMEGAEGILGISELEEWWARGVRLIGPAWAGTRFCGGTQEPGPLTRDGFELLEGMADLGFILDITHMDEEAALQAIDAYPGEVIASHSNALALLRGSDSNRHLTDRVIRGLLERDGMVGIVPFNAFLKAGWKRGDPRHGISLQHVVAQIDYICQMAGDARHVGIGSDFDGGFGLQGTPPGIETIADLQSIAPLLAEKGYTETDIAAILAENWLTRLRRSLPESVS